MHFRSAYQQSACITFTLLKYKRPFFYAAIEAPEDARCAHVTHSRLASRCPQSDLDRGGDIARGQRKGKTQLILTDLPPGLLEAAPAAGGMGRPSLTEHLHGRMLSPEQEAWGGDF